MYVMFLYPRQKYPCGGLKSYHNLDPLKPIRWGFDKTKARLEGGYIPKSLCKIECHTHHAEGLNTGHC